MMPARWRSARRGLSSSASRRRCSLCPCGRQSSLAPPELEVSGRYPGSKLDHGGSLLVMTARVLPLQCARYVATVILPFASQVQHHVFVSLTSPLGWLIRTNCIAEG